MWTHGLRKNTSPDTQGGRGQRKDEKRERVPAIMSSQYLNLDLSDPLNTLCDLNLCCVICVLLYYRMVKSDKITVKYIITNKLEYPTYVTKYQYVNFLSTFLFSFLLSIIYLSIHLTRIISRYRRDTWKTTVPATLTTLQWVLQVNSKNSPWPCPWQYALKKLKTQLIRRWGQTKPVDVAWQ